MLLIHDTLIINASYGFIVTGLMFSLFTTWGGFRLWWVSLTWILLAGLGFALPLWVAPPVSAMSALSDAMAGEVAGQAAYAASAQAVMLASALQAALLVGIVAIPAMRPRSLIVLKQPKSATAIIERTKRRKTHAIAAIGGPNAYDDSAADARNGLRRLGRQRISATNG